MHRAIPVSNKLLSKKWDEMNQAVHTEKLRSMQPRVDSTSPQAAPHAISKAKKEQLLEDRYTEIERENRLLLEKMSTIMQNHHSRERATRKRSLNQEFRRREMLKITVENQALLRRLQDRPPSYSIHKWETDRRRTERLLHNICEFPYQLGVTSNFGEESRKRCGSVEARTATRSEVGAAPLTRGLMSSRKPGSTAAGDRPRKLVPLPGHGKETVFKRGMDINEKYFLVEVNQLPGRLVITAFDIESPDSYNLELGNREAQDLMGGERNYERLVSLLTFENGELMLVDRRREESPRQPSRRKQAGKRGSPDHPKTNRDENRVATLPSPKQKTPDKEVAPVKELPEEKPRLTETPKSSGKVSPPLQESSGMPKTDLSRGQTENEAFDLSQSADFGPKPDALAGGQEKTATPPALRSKEVPTPLAEAPRHESPQAASEEPVQEEPAAPQQNAHEQEEPPVQEKDAEGGQGAEDPIVKEPELQGELDESLQENSKEVQEESKGEEVQEKNAEEVPEENEEEVQEESKGEEVQEESKEAQEVSKEAQGESKEVQEESKEAQEESKREEVQEETAVVAAAESGVLPDLLSAAPEQSPHPDAAE